MLHRNKLEDRIRNLERLGGSSASLETELQELRNKYYQAVADYNLIYPEDLADVLPTQFGNTLKAAENYSGERYGFDGVHLWPRLVQVIPADYKLTIDHVRNELSFLVNMSILSVIFSLLCVLAIFYSMGTVNMESTGPAVFIQFVDQIARYLLAAALGFMSGGFFYSASIFSVGSFGLMIRSSFDLFRLDLLKKLELVRPNNSIEEFETWQNINELIVLGSHSLTFTKIDYRKEE